MQCSSYRKLTRGRSQACLVPQRPTSEVHETAVTSHLRTHFDDYDECRLEEGGICSRVQNGCARLERLEETAYISTESKIIAEENLLNLRTKCSIGSQSTYQIGYR